MICHLIFEELLTQAHKLGNQPIIIPKSMENYVSIQVGCLGFLDTDFFLLDTGMSDDLLKKNLQKLVYPYEKLKLGNMSQPLNLTKEDYWSTLTQSYPNDDDIKRTQEIIDQNNITTGHELTMLYLKMDVLQLADIFENFVEKSTLMYGINPLYSYSAPGYTWKAGLKMTNIKLDFIHSKGLLLLLENKIRGGTSSVMGDRHVQSDENKQILYIDANNLYGWAMSQYLPTGEFEKLPFPNTECNYH